jgi:monoamine oxidase
LKNGNRSFLNKPGGNKQFCVKINSSKSFLFLVTNEPVDNTNTANRKSPSTRTVHIVIVGGGVAGLTCARRLTHLLEKQTYRITVLEARDRVGGRTFSIPELNLDTGASWNFLSQTAVRSLAQQLNISTIEQYESGESLIDSGYNGIQRMDMHSNDGSIKRFKGGTGSLCAAMLTELTTQNESTVTVELNSPVTAIVYDNDRTVIITLRNNRSIVADYVVLALPPKLLISSIRLTPPLSPDISKQLSKCGTWMASTCKVNLVYKRAWWRDQNLSGFAVSRKSRTQEWHDASSDTCNALFAFCRAGTTKQQAIEDTVKMFGKEAMNPTAVYITDWSNEVFTSCSTSDGIDGYVHVNDMCRKSQWNGRLWLGNSEVSDIGGGFLEGAVRRGTQVADQLAASIAVNDDI